MNDLQTLTKLAYEEAMEKIAIFPAIMGAAALAPMAINAIRSAGPAVARAIATYGPAVSHALKGGACKAALLTAPLAPHATKFVSNQAAPENAPYLLNGGLPAKVRDVATNAVDKLGNTDTGRKVKQLFNERAEALESMQGYPKNNSIVTPDY